jgi:hypothetical protein
LEEVGDGITFSVTVPAKGVVGQSYLVLCNCAERVDDEPIVAVLAVMESLTVPALRTGDWGVRVGGWREFFLLG